ncbi:ribonuclease catalytic domain-containing protein [Prochlorococcus sp. MIT 1341]|uniref:ribonuclease catalytic domain-containing protein n=1 Tax=Prochlorococcus sp. MIT 1341 TaxID=3096221 RepID=UPI002A756A73|nr:ribonuclease catalytic domain-containing protein [Prochlorococcus sp. MIT 1341]
MKETSELLEISDKINNGDNSREDLTKLKTYAIDDENSYEIDDAISLERTREGDILWVHIADPCRVVRADSSLDKEAKKRVTSLYLVDRVIPMLPFKLTDNLISLQSCRTRAALSVSILLAEDGSVSKTKICRSWVKVNYSLTYSEADELIDLDPPGDKDLRIISSLLENRLNWRLSNGALIMEQNQGKFYMNDEGNLKVKIIENCLSRRMVREAMILTGSSIADFGNKVNLPLPYKTQTQIYTRFPQNDHRMLDNPVDNSSIKFSLNRSRFQSEPACHSTLGLPAYVQATSPIRRYVDLLVHRQIINFISGNQVFSYLEISELLPKLDNKSREANLIVREDQKKYLMLWLQKNSHKNIECQFLRWMNKSNHLALIYIDHIAFEFFCKFETNQPILPGDRFRMELLSSDVLTGHLHICQSK